MEELKKCIFLIDDDEITNTLNTLLLEENPYCKEIISFTDTDQAFDHLKNQKPAELPHIIFIDYHMPFVTGDEVVKEVKKISPHIKTVILTAHITTPQTVKLLNNSNVDDLIIKPLTPEKIIESFKKLELI